MDIHREDAPVRGETIFECSVPSDLSVKTPLTLRLMTTLLDVGFIAEDESQRFEVCFEEALKNAIVHGNQTNPDASITVRLFRDGDEWGTTISDEGEGFSLEDIPDPNDPDFPWRENGRGVHLMAHMVNRVEYYAEGRTVVLCHPISDPASAEDTVSEDGDQAPLRLSHAGDVILAELYLKGANEAVVRSVFDDILGAIPSAEPRFVILDLAGVPFLPSFGIGCIIRVYKTCVEMGHTFAVTSVGEELGNIFAAMRLDSIFTYYGTPEDAIREHTSTASF